VFFKCSLSVFSTVMWLLKSPLNLKLSLLTFNLLVILKATLQLRKTLEEQLAFSYFIYIYIVFTNYFERNLI
jgi:hypothetical protein